jgi:hypothetical protein
MRQLSRHLDLQHDTMKGERPPHCCNSGEPDTERWSRPMPKPKGNIRCVCQQCGAAFFEFPSGAAIRKFCGLACQGAAKRGRPLPPLTDEQRAKLSAAKTAYYATRKLPPRTCIDCGIQIGPQSTRCQSCASRAKAQATATRQALSARSRAQWARPEYRERIRAAGQERMRTPAARSKMSAQAKALWTRPETRERFQGANHPNWRGGRALITKARLSKKAWRSFRKEYLAAHPAQCELCSNHGSDLHHRIPVQTWPEGEFVESNIQVLCDSCHSKIEHSLRRALRLRVPDERA